MSIHFLILTKDLPHSESGSLRMLEDVLTAEGYSRSYVSHWENVLASYDNSDVVLMEVWDTADARLCSELRRRSHRPVFVFSRGAPVTVLTQGLEAGADAALYMGKGQAVLRAQLNALLRRAGLLSFSASGHT